jgi:hypothetical protein
MTDTTHDPDDRLLKSLRNSKGWPTLGNAAADRIEELKAERDSAKVALMHLERCAQVVSERGAVTGRQWTRLTIAILKARSVLSKLPNPAPSNEPRLVRSEATLAELKGQDDE